MNNARAKANGHSRPLRRAAVLLEVVVAMALLIFGMAVVGLQVNTGLDLARSTDIGTRALMLVDTKMAEIAAGVLRPESNNDQEVKGGFGLHAPGYSWRLQIEPTEIDDFYMLTLDIGYNPLTAEEQIANPDAEVDIEDAGTKIVQTAYRLMPSPANVNISRDFGISTADYEKMKGQAGEKIGGGTGGGGPGAGGGGLPDGGGAGGGLPDGGGAGGQPDMQMLLELLEQYMQGGSFDPRTLSELPAEQLGPMLEQLEKLFGRKGGVAVPVDQVMQQLIGRGRGGRGRDGRRGGGGRWGGEERRGGPQEGEDQDGEGRGRGPRDGQDGDQEEGGGRRFGRDRDDAPPPPDAGNDERPRGRGRNNQDDNGPPSSERRRGGDRDGNNAEGGRGGRDSRERDQAGNDGNTGRRREGGSDARGRGEGGTRQGDGTRQGGNTREGGGTRQDDGRDSNQDQNGRTGGGTRSRR